MSDPGIKKIINHIFMSDHGNIKIIKINISMSDSGKIKKIIHKS